MEDKFNCPICGNRIENYQSKWAFSEPPHIGLREFKQEFLEHSDIFHKLRCITPLNQ